MKELQAPGCACTELRENPSRDDLATQAGSADHVQTPPGLGDIVQQQIRGRSRRCGLCTGTAARFPVQAEDVGDKVPAAMP